MNDRIFKFLVSLWKKDHSKIRPALVPDMIVSISFGTYPDRLTNGTAQSTRSVCSIQRDFFKQAPIVYGVFSPTADYLGEPEKKYRQELLSRTHRSTYTKPIASTIEEALAVKDRFRTNLINKEISQVLIYTEACHSRRAWFVWNKEFRQFGCLIYVYSFDTSFVIEDDQPMVMLRSEWKWLAVNICLYLLWHIPFVYQWFKKNCGTMRQPVS